MKDTQISLFSYNKVLIKTVIRSGHAMDSGKLGEIPKGQIISVCEEAQLPSGVTRFRYVGSPSPSLPAGWVSEKAGDGRQILELLEDDDDPVE